MHTKNGELPRGQQQHGLSVYARLKRAIVDGTLEPGTPLIEQALSAQFDVSRTPVREALKQLAAEGLATRRVSGGFAVAEPTVDEVLDAFAVREVLEGLAASLAAQRATDVDRHRLALILGHVERMLAEEDSDAVLRLTTEFHRLVWKTAGNAQLHDLLVEFEASHGRHRRTSLSYPGRAEEALQEHRAMLDALTARDADAAERLARAHMRRSRDIRLELSLGTPHLADEVEELGIG